MSLLNLDPNIQLMINLNEDDPNHVPYLAAIKLAQVMKEQQKKILAQARTHHLHMKSLHDRIRAVMME